MVLKKNGGCLTMRALRPLPRIGEGVSVDGH